MDLAKTIVDTATTQHKQDCRDRACTLFIVVGQYFKYSVQLVPMAQHILLERGSFQLRVLRDNKEAYQEAWRYLAEWILEDYETADNDPDWYDDGQLYDDDDYEDPLNENMMMWRSQQDWQGCGLALLQHGTTLRRMDLDQARFVEQLVEKTAVLRFLN